MLECPRCGGPVPRVQGAHRQACPHCGLEIGEAGRPLVAAAAQPTPGARPAGPVRRSGRLFAANAGRLLAAWAPVWVLWLGASVLIEAYAESRGLHEAGGGDVLSLINYLALSVPVVLPVMTVALALFGALAAELADAGRLRAGAVRARLKGRGASVLAAAFVLTVLVSAGVLTLVLPFLFLYWYVYAVPLAASGAPRLAAAFDGSRRHVRSGGGRGAAAAAVLVFLVGSVASFAANGSGLSLLPRQVLVSALDVAPWVAITCLAAAGMPRARTATPAAAATEMSVVRRA